VQVDERHRSGEARDPVGDPVLDVASLLLGVLQQRRVDGLGELRGNHEASEPAAVGCGGGGCLVHIHDQTPQASRL